MPAEPTKAELDILCSHFSAVKGVCWSCADRARKVWVRETLERAAKVAERQVILDAMSGLVDARPFGKEIAAEIRSLEVP